MVVETQNHEHLHIPFPLVGRALQLGNQFSHVYLVTADFEVEN